LKLIACVSDGGGILFAGRRVSRDAAVIGDVVSVVGDGVLFTSDYSAALFEGSALSSVVVSNPLESAERDDFVFLESRGAIEYKDKIDTLIIYRWNRKYPFDVRLDIDPRAEGMTLSETVEFSGKSHEKITRERWIR